MAIRKDSLINGAVLGLIIGVLIASSNISWISSIVDTIIGFLSEDFQSLTYVRYFVIGIIGLGAGIIVDRY